MKKAIKTLLIASVLALPALAVKAQDYKAAAGLRFSYEAGPSLKYFIEKDVALEGVLGFRSHGLVFTGLWEKHLNAFDVPALNFYYGFGGHIGGVGAGTYKRFNGDNIDYTNNTILVGADGVVGLEYTIPKSPIAVSADLNPRLELGHGPFFDIQPSIGVKYIFN